MVFSRRAMLLALAPLFLVLQPRSAAPIARLVATYRFGSNPGNLAMWHYAPLAQAGEQPALVVALHGCSGSAQHFSQAGFNELADRHGFYVLYPEQRTENHRYRCFNHLTADDVAIGEREIQSVMQMVHFMVKKFGIDERRVFITGFSSGGQMAAIVAATYPAHFRAGAIIGAGGYICESGHAGIAGFVRCPGAPKLRKKLRQRKSSHWPRMSIWHGTNDQNVPYTKMDIAVTQWRRVHGLLQRRAVTEQLPGDVSHKVYRNRAGRNLVESYTMNNAGHVIPVHPGCGSVGVFLEESPLCFAREATRFFGLHKEPVTAAF